MIMCNGNYGTTLLLINAKLDHTLKSYLQFNQCQLIEPHEPLAILVKYDMYLCLAFYILLENPEWVTDQNWCEDYRQEY